MGRYIDDYELLENVSPEDMGLCCMCEFEFEKCPADWDCLESNCKRHKKVMKIVGTFCNSVNKMIDEEPN